MRLFKTQMQNRPNRIKLRLAFYAIARPFFGHGSARRQHFARLSHQQRPFDEFLLIRLSKMVHEIEIEFIRRIYISQNSRANEDVMGSH